MGAVPADLFAPLSSDATMSDVGIASAQLAEYLGEGAEDRDRIGELMWHLRRIEQVRQKRTEHREASEPTAPGSPHETPGEGV